MITCAYGVVSGAVRLVRAFPRLANFGTGQRIFQVDKSELDTIKTIVLEWTQTATLKDEAVEKEREQRAKVKYHCFPNAVRGTQRFDLQNGYKLKLQQTFTYKLGDKAMVDPATNQLIPITKQIEELQTAIADLGNEGPLLSDRLIKWEPKIVDSEYRKLNDDFPVEKAAKELIDQLLTITKGSPQIVLEPPK